MNERQLSYAKQKQQRHLSILRICFKYWLCCNAFTCLTLFKIWTVAWWNFIQRFCHSYNNFAQKRGPLLLLWFHLTLSHKVFKITFWPLHTIRAPLAGAAWVSWLPLWSRWTRKSQSWRPPWSFSARGAWQSRNSLITWACVFMIPLGMFASWISYQSMNSK